MNKRKLINSQSKSNPIELKLGNQVAVTNENRKKLEQVYNGPFTVIEISDPNVKIKNSQTTQTIHKNRIIKL